MIQRFRPFISILLTGTLAATVAIPAAAQAPAAPQGERRRTGRSPTAVRTRPERQERRTRFAVFRAQDLHRSSPGPGSLDLLHSRFREHTNRLFQKYGMTIVGFWTPTNKPNALIYLLAYKDRRPGTLRGKGSSRIRSGRR
jgi:hypothetical protein